MEANQESNLTETSDAQRRENDIKAYYNAIKNSHRNVWAENLPGQKARLGTWGVLHILEKLYIRALKKNNIVDAYTAYLALALYIKPRKEVSCEDIIFGLTGNTDKKKADFWSTAAEKFVANNQYLEIARMNKLLYIDQPLLESTISKLQPNIYDKALILAVEKGDLRSVSLLLQFPGAISFINLRNCYINSKGDKHIRHQIWQTLFPASIFISIIFPGLASLSGFSLLLSLNNDYIRIALLFLFYKTILLLFEGALYSYYDLSDSAKETIINRNSNNQEDNSSLKIQETVYTLTQAAVFRTFLSQSLYDPILFTCLFGANLVPANAIKIQLYIAIYTPMFLKLTCVAERLDSMHRQNQEYKLAKTITAPISALANTHHSLFYRNQHEIQPDVELGASRHEESQAIEEVDIELVNRFAQALTETPEAPGVAALF